MALGQVERSPMSHMPVKDIGNLDLPTSKERKDLRMTMAGSSDENGGISMRGSRSPAIFSRERSPSDGDNLFNRKPKAIN